MAGAHAVVAEAPVVAAAGGMAGQRVAVTPDAERGRRARDHHHPNGRLVVEPGEHLAVLGVHAAGPCVVAVRPVQPHGRDMIVDLDPGRVEIEAEIGAVDGTHPFTESFTEAFTESFTESFTEAFTDRGVARPRWRRAPDRRVRGGR